MSMDRHYLYTLILLVAVGIYSNLMLAYAQTEIEDYLALIQAIAVTLPIITGIISIIIAEVRKRAGDHEVLDSIEHIISIINKNVEATDKWILENKKDLKNFIDAIMHVLPQEQRTKLQELLARYELEVNKLTDDIMRSNENLRNLYVELENILSKLPYSKNKNTLETDAKRLIDNS